MPFVLIPSGGTPAPSEDAPISGNFNLVPAAPLSNPADELSPVGRFVAGYGATLTDRLLGLKQRITQMQASGALDAISAGDTPGAASLDTRAEGQARVNALSAEAADKRATDAPLKATTAGTFGGIASDVAALLPTAGTGLPGAIGFNAALGALEPTTGDESTVANMVKSGLAGAGGQLVADFFGSALRGVKPTDAQVQAAKSFADQWGGVVSRGQMAGSELLQRVENMANAMGSKFGAQSREANTGAVKRAFDSVTGGDAGALYEKLAPYGFTVDQQLADVSRNAGAPFKTLPEAQQPKNALDALQELFVGRPGTPNPAIAGMGPQAQASAVAQGVPATIGGVPAKLAVGDTLPMVGPRGDFNNYQNMRSLYSKLAQGNEPENAVYGDLTDALDDAAGRNLAAQGVDANTIDGIRRAYSLEKFMRPAAIVDESGNVTGYDPTKVAAIVKRIEATQPGRLDRMGDVGDLMRQAAAFGRTVKPTSSSGTAENQIAGKVAGLELLKDAMGSMMHGGNVFGALMEGLSPIAGAVYAPRLVNFLMQSTRNGILPEAKSALGKGAADVAGYLGQAGARALPLTLSLGDLLPAPSTPQ